jgi:hypothetical protein
MNFPADERAVCSQQSALERKNIGVARITPNQTVICRAKIEKIRWVFGNVRLEAFGKVGFDWGQNCPMSGGADFPRSDTSLFIHNLVCHDTLIHVDAWPRRHLRRRF